MAVRSQEMRNTARPNIVAGRAPITVPPITFHTFAYIITGLLALLAIYAIMGNVVTWGRERVDDMRYGATRTYHTDAVVGHEDGTGTPTHFVAMNLNRQVVIVEIPGANPEKTRVITGPYLFGSSEDRTPVLLQFEDVNRDGTQDMIVDIKNEAIIYLNRDGGFHPITPEERMKLAQPGK